MSADELSVEELRKRITILLACVGDEGRCRGCQAPIYWVRHLNGKAVPYNKLGLNHFADCPAREDFRK